MATSSLSFNNLTVGDLLFSNVMVNETDVGNVTPFTATGPAFEAVTGSSYTGVQWGVFDSAVYGAGSSETMAFSYDVTVSDPTQAITSINSLYVVDLFTGLGNSVTAVENVYDDAGDLVGTQTWSQGVATSPITLAAGFQHLHVTLTLTESIDATTGTAASAIDMSVIQQTFGQTSTSQLCSIGDIVFLDTTGSGVESGFDAGPGVSGVTVQLLNATGTAVLETTTTDANGRYAFNNLLAGTYEVKFVTPTGYTLTTQGVGGNSAINSSANQTTGITGPITLVAGQANHNVEAGILAPGSGAHGTAALGDFVWMDTNRDGIFNSSELGVAGVTVRLLNSTGTAVIATTTTDSTGHYAFTNLNAGTYEVQFVAPTGDGFTLASQGTNSAIDSNANQSTGVTAPVTLSAGQVNNTIDAGLVSNASISITKTPCKAVVNSCGQMTYTFKVTNTGTTALKNVSVKDNIGTATNPDIVSANAVLSGNYNVGDVNHNGLLDGGESWQYTQTINQIGCSTGSSGSVCHTASGSHLSAGNTAWLNSSFNPTSTKDGATYVFQGIKCTITGGGVGNTPLTEKLPDAVVTFSKNCTQATTTYDADRNCWVTTVPAGSNPGSVFLTGLPVTVPKGYDLTNAKVTWTIDDASNNCGASNVTWDASCQGYSSFGKNGCDGASDYNQIGVKVCDNSGGYGSGGSCDSGYGWNGNNYCNTGNSGYGGYGGGYGYGNNYGSSGWVGSSDDCAGTPENQNTQNNCDNSGYSQSCGGYGGSGGYGCGSSGSGSSGGSCDGSGGSSQNQLNITGAADTATVTASTASGQVVTASDTKEVQVLGSNSSISVDGATPTGSLSALYGSARVLEFTYNPSNTVSLKQVQAGLGTVSGSNSNSMAFIEISNNSNPYAANANIYFEGSVSAGEEIYADATRNIFTNTANAASNDHFDTTAGSHIFAFVFKSAADFAAGAAPLQTIAYNTSGSQAMHFGDQVGSLKVVGFVGSNGGHLASN